MVRQEEALLKRYRDIIIGAWVVGIICMTVILGEIKYHYFDQKEKISAQKAVAKDRTDNERENIQCTL